MRILWLAPWFRTLAEVWARPLRAMGHDVLVVTSERHFEPVSAEVPEEILRYSPRSTAGCREFVSLRRRIKAFAPDVVVSEEVRDPRLLLLGRNRPLALLIHDARPHDAMHRRSWQRKTVGMDQRRRTSRRIVFSESVRGLLDTRGSPVTSVPLPSEMLDELVPPFVEQHDRRDFVLIGRMNPYKNLPVVMAAWRRHVASPSYQGDRLILLGDGIVDTELAPKVEWRRERFAFADVVDTVAAAKASIAVYRAGSQSGVALWSMQVGTPVIVSNVGGLPEYMPSGEFPLDPQDVEGLAERIGELSDPATATASGRAATTHYRSRCGADISAARLVHVLEDIV